jgi:hypothetical protein
MGAPGSRILLSPGGLSRGCWLRAVFRHGRLPKPGPLDDPGLMPVSGPGIQIGDTGASGSSWPGFPPPALCAVASDRFRHNQG